MEKYKLIEILPSIKARIPVEAVFVAVKCDKKDTSKTIKAIKEAKSSNKYKFETEIGQRIKETAVKSKVKLGKELVFDEISAESASHCEIEVNHLKRVKSVDESTNLVLICSEFVNY